LIRNKGPWRGLDDVEYATAEWVGWFNNARPHTALDYYSPDQWETLHPNGLPQPDDHHESPAETR